VGVGVNAKRTKLFFLGGGRIDNQPSERKTSCRWRTAVVGVMLFKGVTAGIAIMAGTTTQRALSNGNALVQNMLRFCCLEIMLSYTALLSNITVYSVDRSQ